MGTNVIKDRRPPKVYRIERDEKTGAVIVHVGIKWPAGTSWRLLGHCKLHSPTGFEVGYGGSGPADTAASILADYFEENPRAAERAWRGRSNGDPSIAIKLHQFFNFEVISGVRLEAGAVYTLDESQITDWLVEKHPEFLNSTRLSSPERHYQGRWKHRMTQHIPVNRLPRIIIQVQGGVVCLPVTADTDELEIYLIDYDNLEAARENP